MRASILIILVEISEEETKEQQNTFFKTSIEFIKTTNADDTPGTIRRGKLSNQYFKFIFFLPLNIFIQYFFASLVFFWNCFLDKIV